jgi:hypothetical protein
MKDGSRFDCRTKMPKRTAYAIFLVILVPLGLSTKFYTGVAADWVYKYGGDIFYPAFWYFLIKLLQPDFSMVKTALIVLFFCITVEISQLIDDPLFRWGRHHFLGRVLLGTDFSWWDIAYYAVGCSASMALDLSIDRTKD